MTTPSFKKPGHDDLRTLYHVSRFYLHDKKEGVVLPYFLGVMINRNSWGCLYFIDRGEILGFMKDKLMRKHSSRIFSCDKERKLEA